MADSFVIDQKELFTVLSSMQPICAKRTTLDVTSCILFHIGHKEITLKSTDLEISLQSRCAIQECSVIDNKSFLVPGKRIFDIVKELDGELKFYISDRDISLFSNNVELALNIKSVEEFPPFPERIENLMDMEASFLLSLLDKVSFLIPQNNANQALNGLFMELTSQEMKLTSTDGHCLAQVRTSHYSLPETRTWLIPRRAVFELKKVIDSSKVTTIFLGMCGNQLVFSGESFNFFTKLLADQFPEYTSILDKEGFIPAKIARANLIKTLRRSTCLLSGQFLATQFEFNKDVLHVSMQNKEVGQLKEVVPLENFQHDEIDIRFYAPYLLNGLVSFPDELITFYLKNETRPIMFDLERTEYHMIYLVMPVSPTVSQS